MATREIATDLKLTGEKAFNDSMKAVNSNMKTLKSEMGAVTSEFGKNDASMSQNIRVSKNLKAQNEQQREVIRAATIALKQNEDAYGKDSKQADKFRQIIASAQTTINKNNIELKKHNVALKAMQVVGKGAEATMKGVGKTIGAVGSAAGATAKGIGKITAGIASGTVAGVAAISAGGVALMAAMAKMAHDAADAAKAASEAGEPLTQSQEQWLAYAQQLDGLDRSVANAKSALAGVLLPMLSDLSVDGAAFLNDFTRDMTEAAGDTEKQTKILSDYIVKGANLIKEKLPEYISAGKELFSGLADGLSDSAPELLGIGFDLCIDLLDGIIENAPELAAAGISLTEELISGLSERGPDLLVSAFGLVSNLVSGLAEAAPTLVPAAMSLIGQLVMTLIREAPQLVEAGLNLLLGLVAGLLNGLSNISGSADEIIATFKESFDESMQLFLDIGGKIVDLIQKGLADAWEGFKDWFGGIWDSLFGNRSVNVSVNADAAGGGVDGSHASGLSYVPFDGYLAQLHKGEAVLTAAEAAAYRRGKAGGGNRTVNLYITAKQLTQADIQMIVRTVNEELGEAI